MALASFPHPNPLPEGEGISGRAPHNLCGGPLGVYHFKSRSSKTSVFSQNEKARYGGSINLASPSARPCTRAIQVSGAMAVAIWARRASQVADSPSFPLRSGVHPLWKSRSSPSLRPQGLLIAAKPEKTALRHSGIELALNNHQMHEMHEHQEISLADLPDSIATDSGSSFLGGLEDSNWRGEETPCVSGGKVVSLISPPLVAR